MGHPRGPFCHANEACEKCTKLSADPKLTGAPSDHVLPVRGVRLAVGAVFVVVLTRDVMTMPGLPRTPSVQAIDVDGEGRITGLF